MYYFEDEDSYIVNIKDRTYDVLLDIENLKDGKIFNNRLFLLDDNEIGLLYEKIKRLQMNGLLNNICVNNYSVNEDGFRYINRIEIKKNGWLPFMEPSIIIKYFPVPV